MNTALPNPGDQLGDYRLVREIGRGAMGVVYEAIPLGLGAAVSPHRHVALKLLVFPPLLPEGEREALIVRFAREARALASVRHPHVVQVYEVAQVDGQPYMVMELLGGQNAREWLTRHGPMPWQQVVRLGSQLCEALAAVHAAGIVHRDIKPENVVLEADGTIRLTDFGIARMEVEASLTRTGGLIGSPAYMAPEQILGGTVDARADLFSAGVALYQMLAGELPFQGTGLMEVAHRVAYDPPQPLTGLPPALAELLLRALEKDPGQRYASAEEFRAALETYQHSPTHPLSAIDPDLPSTGGVLEDACSLHSGRPAVAHCVECEAALCSRCVRHRRGQVWCPDHAAPPARPAWVIRLEVLAIGLLFTLLLWSLYPIRW